MHTAHTSNTPNTNQHTKHTHPQYGGDEDAPPLGSGLHGPFSPAHSGTVLGGGGGGGFRVGKLSNAYMLVYVRVAQWDDVMCRVTKDDIPQYLRERLEVGSSYLFV